MRGSALALALVTSVAGAQTPALELSLAAAEHRVNAGAGREVSSGLIYGVGLSSDFGTRLLVRVDARAGHFSTDGTDSERDVGELSTSVSFQALRWLRGVARLGTRVYAAPIARQRWTTASLGAEVRLPFSGSRLVALGRGAWLPVASVTDLETPTAVTAAAGLEYRGSHARLTLTYGLERYDFPAAGGFARREQVRTLNLLASWNPWGRR